MLYRGVPTSLRDSHEQWDYPNAWAPLQHILVMGLFKNRGLNMEAGQLAFDLAQKWVLNNYEGYRKTKEANQKKNPNGRGAMFEKVRISIISEFPFEQRFSFPVQCKHPRRGGHRRGV